MQICVMGLGYVGCVSAACLAEQGHTVVGVDLNSSKVATVNAGESPIVEDGVTELVARNVQSGRLSATTEASSGLAGAELVIVCVGTPSQRTGDIDTSQLLRVCADIGSNLGVAAPRAVLVIRSTVPPSTVRAGVVPAVERASGLKYGEGFGVAFHPEFLREGSSVSDYYNPPKIVIGCDSKADAAKLSELYQGFAAPVFETSLEVAEMAKYVDNSFHALKTAFANEVGDLCKQLGLDSHAVMDVFVSDTKLNISSKYLRPGNAFGGSCLPKDLRALNALCSKMCLELPVLKAILDSNELHMSRAVELVMEGGRRPVGFLGLSFKAGTDDLRESPMVLLAERLLGKGYPLKIYDRYVKEALLVGSNRAFVESRLGHLSEYLVDSAEEVEGFAEVLVLGYATPELAEVVRRAKPHQRIVDLVRIARAPAPATPATYAGLCW